jgi:hypothetical protein
MRAPRSVIAHRVSRLVVWMILQVGSIISGAKPSTTGAWTSVMVIWGRISDNTPSGEVEEPNVHDAVSEGAGGQLLQSALDDLGH